MLALSPSSILTPQSLGPSGGGDFVGALDEYISSLAVVLSVILRLLSSYTGPLFRVRADRTGQPEQDIGFLANGSVDIASLQAFVGSDDAFITKVYRQDGSTNHLEQSTQNVQPRIASGGVIDEGLLFSGVQFMGIASASASEYTDGTNTQVVCDLKPTADGRLFDFGPDSLSAWFPLGGVVYLDLPFPAARVSAATPSGLLGSFHVCSIEREGSSVRLRTDGNVEISGSAGGSISGTSVFNVGATTSGSGGWSGILRSMVIWKDCSSPATRAALL